MKHPTTPRRFITWSRQGARANASLEFALVLTMMLPMITGMLDLGLAFNEKMQLTNTVTAAAEYAVMQGESITSAAALSTFTSNVNAVIAGASPIAITSKTVTFNKTNDYTNYYCLSGTSPATATYTLSSSGASCGNNVLAGQYVTITVTAQFDPLVYTSSALAQFSQLSDSVIVRVN